MSKAGVLTGPEGSVRKREKPLGYWTIVLRQLMRNRGAVLGGLLLLFILVVALAAPLLAPYDPIKMYDSDRLKPPSRDHLLGTDNFGRDILSRIMFGARISLAVGLVSVGVGVTAGITLGLISGYFGSWLDAIIMRLMDALLAFPGILLALAIMAALGSNLRNVMIAVGVSSVPRFTRVVRASVLSARERPYVEAARCTGCRPVTVMVRHILPNVLGPIIVLGTLGSGGAILTSAGLSFLGLGAQPPTPEWGLMLNTGRPYLVIAPWIITFPGLAIMVAVLAVNMLGDGLRDAFDPRLRID